MSDQTVIVELTQKHVNQSADVLTRSFLNLNDLWKSYKPSYEEIFPIMRGKVLPAVNSGWSFVLLRGQKVIGLSIQYELLDFLQLPSMPSNLTLFKKLGQAGKILEQKLDLTGLKRGDAIYGLFGVIDPDEASKGHSLKFWWNLFALGKVAGWKYYYSRISSPVSLKMLKQLGAQELGEITVEGAEGSKSDQKIWMIRIDLTKPFPSYTMLSAMTAKKNRKERAKL